MAATRRRKVDSSLMMVYIVNNFGSSLQMSVVSTTTIREIKNRIYSEQGIAVENQQLLYDYKELDDKHNLNYYGIEDKERILLIIKMVAGPIRARRLRSEEDISFAQVQRIIEMSQELMKSVKTGDESEASEGAMDNRDSFTANDALSPEISAIRYWENQLTRTKMKEIYVEMIVKQWYKDNNLPLPSKPKPGQELKLPSIDSQTAYQDTASAVLSEPLNTECNNSKSEGQVRGLMLGSRGNNCEEEIRARVAGAAGIQNESSRPLEPVDLEHKRELTHAEMMQLYGATLTPQENSSRRYTAAVIKDIGAEAFFELFNSLELGDMRKDQTKNCNKFLDKLSQLYAARLQGAESCSEESVRNEVDEVSSSVDIGAVCAENSVSELQSNSKEELPFWLFDCESTSEKTELKKNKSQETPSVALSAEEELTSETAGAVGITSPEVKQMPQQPQYTRNATHSNLRAGTKREPILRLPRLELQSKKQEHVESENMKASHQSRPFLSVSDAKNPSSFSKGAFPKLRASSVAVLETKMKALQINTSSMDSSSFGNEGTSTLQNDENALKWPFTPLRTSLFLKKDDDTQNTGRANTGSDSKVPKRRKSSIECAESKCHKKLKVSNIFICRCQKKYCSYHRNPEMHDCTYDYKSEGRKILEKDNPLVIATKLPKI